MSRPSISEPQAAQQDAGAFVALGGWLFRKRTSLPLPIVALLLLVPPRAADGASTWLVFAGIPVVALGELIRLWGVHHIGAISRTRSERLGPLIDSGPFAHVRNPLYIGNVLLWLGFAVSARLPWLAPVIFILLALEYHAIVRWEERLLEERLGDRYRAYARQVPRWVPRLSNPEVARNRHVESLQGQPFSWADTFYSERGTLIAIAVGFLLLWAKTLL